MNGFLPSSGTLVGSTVMSSTSYPFGWNWNSGDSVTPVNFIVSVLPSSGFPFPRGSNASMGLPFLGGNNTLRISPFLGGIHVSSGLPFLKNVNVLGIYPLSRGTYPPSNFWKQGGTYPPNNAWKQGGNTFQGGYPSTPNSYMGVSYGCSVLDTPLHLD